MSRFSFFFFFYPAYFEIISLLFNHLPRGVRGGCAGRPSSVPSVRAADRKTMFVFFSFSARLLQKPRLDCTVKNGPRSAPRSVSFFSPQHNFLPVNWSVFASLSTPAKQHPPRSYRISIRSFPPRCLLATPVFLLLHGCLRVIFTLRSFLLPPLWKGAWGEGFLWRSLWTPLPLPPAPTPARLALRCLASGISAAHANIILPSQRATQRRARQKKTTTTSATSSSFSPVGVITVSDVRRQDFASTLRWLSRNHSAMQ